MDKNLPKMYQNKINKSISNTQNVYSTLSNSFGAKKYSSVSIDKKIDDIFNASDYVYKADVIIVTDNDKLKKRVVARNKNNLITMDNEYIPISIIRDIYK